MTWRWWPSQESEIIKSRLIFNHFTHFPRQIRCQFGLQLIRGVPDPNRKIKNRINAGGQVRMDAAICSDNLIHFSNSF